MSDVRTTSQLADTLHAIGRWYPGTADPPRTAASTIRSTPGSKPPIPADVLSLRRETVDILTSWALLVAEERDLCPDIDTADVPALVSFLSTHAAWLAGHVAGLDALAELSRVARSLEEVVRQTRPARVKISPCPEDGCGGTLKATVRRDEDLLPSTIVCDADGEHAWTTWAWHALGRRVAPFRPVAVRRLLTALADDVYDPRSFGTGRVDDHTTRRDSA